MTVPSVKDIRWSDRQQRVGKGRRRVPSFAVAGGAALAATSAAVAFGIGTFAGATQPPPNVIPPSSSNVMAVSVSSGRGLAVMGALPVGSQLEEWRSVVHGTANYEEITTKPGADGGRYEVSLYHTFAASELDGAGLRKVVTTGGTFWIGSDDPNQRSVYYLNSQGAGVWVMQTSPLGQASSLDSLEATATRLAGAS